MLKPLKPSASESEKQRYFTLIKQLAKESAVIDIRQCAPQPLVLKTKTGATIMVRNADTREHIVSFGENKALLVPAKESKTLPINYFKGSGVFGYGCDGSPGGVGLIFVAD
ncbi:MAG: hypothetical protein HY006_02390 [Candidatus Sungbacteria bacterium]|nr:hypothetical protein [Candidatus Sungbacteria bacterium]